MSDLMLDVGQANELKMAFRRADYTSEEVKRLSEGNILGEVRNVLRGLAEVKPIDHAIDHSKTPKFPFNGASVEEHRGTGVSKLERRGDDLYLDGKKILLHLEKSQKDDSIQGHKLREKLAKQTVLDANILDYLVEHPELIPDTWKQDEEGRTRYVFFWGTVFRHADGNLCVRCLCWGDGGWQVDYGWLVSDWFVSYPAALLAS